MSRSILLMDLGAGPLPSTTPPVAVSASWVPAVYVPPPPPPPTSLVIVAIADAVTLAWAPSTMRDSVTVIETAPDVAGVPRWVRLRAVALGKTSAYTVAALATPAEAATVLRTIVVPVVANVVTIDGSLGEMFRVSLTDDATLETINIRQDYVFILEVEQTGAFNLDLPPEFTPFSGPPYATTQVVGAVDTIGGETADTGVSWELRFTNFASPDLIFGVTITPNPAYDHSSANPSIAVLATPANGTTPYTIAWSRAPGGVGDWGGSSGNTGGADFACSTPTGFNPTFSRAGSGAGYVVQNWRCVVTDAAGLQTQWIFQVGLEDDGEIPGGRGGFDCPSRFAWLPGVDGGRPRQAWEVKAGDRIVVVDPWTGVESLETVTRSTSAVVPGVRLFTEAGVTLECSRSAPMPLTDGTRLPAALMAGLVTRVKRRGVWLWSKVTRAKLIEHLEVQHISCNEQYYLVGDAIDNYMAHHNIREDTKWKPEGYEP